MKNPLNSEFSPLNQDPMGRNSMGSEFNPTPAHLCAVTCMTEISLIMTFNNQIHLTSLRCELHFIVIILAIDKFDFSDGSFSLVVA